ncbi:glycoside hydrolase family 2 TIM barrel-domain containing protein [Streptomyces sp. NPDC094034]|uniref:glycoside hydrolase family 2 TIM barrel-domain containing protein n=1 Tax=Streptomyces sp. NPDC094034 TaxID=3155309 RepID=UPI003321EBA1
MRSIINLDGAWTAAEGSLGKAPEAFDHTVPVPGLLDMASPSFAEVGLQSSLREAFWMRREFDLDREPAPLNLLQIGKARYGTKVILNGVEIGEHRPNHTVGEFDLTGALQRGRNELLVRLGPWRDEEPTPVPDGRDIEAYLAVPGIYDSVELVLAEYPYIDVVKTAPDLDAGSVRVLARLRAGDEPAVFTLAAVVREAASGDERGSTNSGELSLAPHESREVELEVALESPRLWSPEDPFLYVLDLSTPADSCSVRFGMRSFVFDRASGYALLNGQRYPMRGSAAAMFRFFEDPDRGGRPWDPTWVRRLHRQFKAMHWNTIRYAIGFPPDFWYDIADEEGLLVIDEFPLFYIDLSDDAPAVEAARALDPSVRGHGLRSITEGQPRTTEPARVPWPAVLTADALETEFSEWVEGHCNHPSVVMWVSNCEGRSPETRILVERIRELDPQHRPWGDGWSGPPTDADPYVAHWYLQWNAAMRKEPAGIGMLSGMRKTAIGYPLGGAPQELLPHLRTPNKDFDGVPVNTVGNAVLLEEYGWLWLTRDGKPTRLTEPIYESLDGWPAATADERRYTRARLTAAETEFFRCNRTLAGLLLFCALSSSHDRVSTADAFTDVESLDYEPHFLRYVRDAFAPVALMVDVWDRRLRGGILHEIPVAAINDLPDDWNGDLVVRVRDADSGELVSEQRRTIRIPALGQERQHFGLTTVIPDGEHQIVAELTDGEGYSVRSVRDVRVASD